MEMLQGLESLPTSVSVLKIKAMNMNKEDIFKALEVVERDSIAIADSYTSLFASLRLALSQVTNTSVDHLEGFSDAAGKLQESAIDAATSGNRFIHSYLREKCSNFVISLPLSSTKQRQNHS